jgi:hypothetical protein
MNINFIFETALIEQRDIDKFNHKLFSLDEKKRKMCTIHPTDSGNKKRKKCVVARVWGVHHAPVWDRYVASHPPADIGAGDSGGEAGGEGGIAEEKSSTERVRKYYKRHPEKVRKYLKKTQDDRVARNRDRRKAVKKYGKSKMKNHDVHHPNGAKNGNWKLAKKDHGRDKKNENVQYVYLSELMKGHVPNGPWILLSEGGAAGHLAHPYEDGSLTFADIKEMVKRGLVGGLDAEGPVTEKLDGQNITFTVRDGRVVFARNKGQIKNRGQDALDVSGVRSMFAGHENPNVERAFTQSAEDLETAINALPPEQRDEMFKNGSKFMNVEVIFPDTKNVIPYDKPVLVFHGTIEYDDAGEEIGRDVEDGKLLDKRLQAVNAQKQKTFGIAGPQAITFNDADTIRSKEKLQKYGADIARMQTEFGLDEKSTIDDYKKAWWSREIDNMGIDWTPEEREKLIIRWATGEKKFNAKHIEDPEKKKFFKEFEDKQLKGMQKRAGRPLERLFLKLGADSLLRITNTLSANNPKIAIELKQEVADIIRQVKETGDENQLAVLQREMERLEDIGIDNIVPTEGVVFIYNGKPYKFTGAFAPINQILGILKFKRGKAKEVTPEEPKAEPTQEKPTEPEPGEPQPEPTADGKLKPVAIFPGRFQPFHAGHYSVYQSLVKKFGRDNVYIATSDKTVAATSPFNFAERKNIMTQMFDIPEDKIVQTKIPQRAEEIIKNLPPGTPVVLAVSEKNKERFTDPRYYSAYTDDGDLVGHEDKLHYMVAPEMQLQLQGKNISGTQVRALLGNPNITDDAKKEIFTKIYGKFDPEIFKKIVKTTTDSEEALKLTQQFGAEKKPRGKKAKEPTQEPTPEPAAKQSVQQPTPQQEPAQQPTAQPPVKVHTGTGPVNSDEYLPGEVWRMPKGNYGAKNQKGRIQYFGTEEKARQYAQQRGVTK